jgi:hypothetical protein
MACRGSLLASLNTKQNINANSNYDVVAEAEAILAAAEAPALV